MVRRTPARWSRLPMLALIAVASGLVVAAVDVATSAGEPLLGLYIPFSALSERVEAGVALILQAAAWISLISGPGAFSLAAVALVALALGLALAPLGARLRGRVARWVGSPIFDGDSRMAELSDRLAGAHTVASVIAEARNLFAELFAPAEALVFIEDEGGRLRLRDAEGECRRELRIAYEMLDRLRCGEVLIRSDVDGGAGPFPSAWREVDIDLLLPLRGSPLFGALALGPKASRKAYSAREIRFLRTASNQLALGLTKAMLFEQMEEDAGISAVLIRAQNEIAFSLNAPDILDRLCQITATALDLECSHTLMWQSDQEAFVVVSSFGDSPERAEERKLVRVPRAALGDLLLRLKKEDAIVNRGVRYRNLTDLFDYHQASVVIMPLRREGELIGLHLAGSRTSEQSFTSRHERIARGIGHAASMALANAYLMEELASASRVKSDFVASMSHELRTPLNHIIGYNDLLLDGSFGAISEEQQDTLERVRRSSHNLLDLIEATLNLSRLDANKMAVDVREVDIPFLIAELADRLEHSCRKPGVDVEWKVRREVATLRTDPIKLQMILKNLVENAVKFTDRGRVVITVRQRADGVEFEVSDNGAGIPRELQASIFEPFRRVHDPHASPGVGLGLHIVRRLVDLMQGTISVASEVDLGSCFRVWLPASPQQRSYDDPPAAALAPISATLH